MAKSPRKEYFKKWYEANRERVQARKAERYQEDPEVRERAKARAKFHYWTKRRVPAAAAPMRIPFEGVTLPETTRTVDVLVENKADVRYGETVTVSAYSTGQVAEITGRQAQTIRIWIGKGVLPEANVRNTQNYRMYTADQIRAIIICVPLLNSPHKEIKRSLFARELADMWAEMPDGIVPLYAGTVALKDGILVRGHARPIIGEDDVWFTADNASDTVRMARDLVTIKEELLS